MTDAIEARDGAAPMPVATDAAGAAGPHPLDVIALLVIAAGEGLLLAGWLWQSDANLLVVAAIHLGTLVALAAVAALAFRHGHEQTVPLLALVAGLALGPIGPLGAVLTGLPLRRARPPGPLIQDWYDRIALSTAVAPEERLCEDVGVGRTLNLTAPPPEAFTRIMIEGDLADRQTVLGLIARNFDVAHVEPLQLGLQSPEPTIRVQAAAVAAHIAPAVRRRLRHCTDRIESDISRPLAALGLLTEIDALAGSGLLDEADRVEATTGARRLADAVLAAHVRRPLRLPYTSDPARAAGLEAGLERLLLARGRFGALRSLRRARRVLARLPNARFRPLAAMPDRSEARR